MSTAAFSPVAPSSPFALLLEPQAVLSMLDAFAAGTRRIYRPLDKPLIPRVRNAELAAFDSLVDDAEDEDEFEDASAQA